MADEITFLPSPIQQSLIAELQDGGKQQSMTAESASSQEITLITATSRDGFAMSLSDGSIKAVPQSCSTVSHSLISFSLST